MSVVFFGNLCVVTMEVLGFFIYPLRINQDKQVKEKDSEEESEADDDDEEEEGRSDNDSSDEEGKKDIEDVSFAMETTKDKKEQKKIESDKVEVKDFDWLIDFFKTELVT